LLISNLLLEEVDWRKAEVRMGDLKKKRKNFFEMSIFPLTSLDEDILLK
jgi:hypothetical protein